ncbi:hypothetical protein [Facklamia miroungae]|uniref:Uncharacterized protein n=1 Tax=Facklamia miroungae TaxID=120956 RepID=A0A1G7P276_9LACT|nr:hypothetical protein [Facklamia miroungae]NKZ28555.1 hypothetical protein [Facklamia miroungae]SDF80341.1 hypothetical protein SAMN05421791_10196 [Facklamia miroungae]
MLKTKQWLNHSIDLSTTIEKVSQDQVNKLIFKLILLLPSSMIATNIRTGFPVLISIEREYIKNLLIKQIDLHLKDQPFQLSDLNSLIEKCQDIITHYYNDHSLIDLDSVQVEINYFLKNEKFQ